MIHSMTGFATLSQEIPSGTIHLELKTVNSRFLDIQFRIGEELRLFESLLRETIINQVSRGKIECRFNLIPFDKQEQLTLNQELLNQIIVLANSIRERYPASPPMTIGEILRWPNILLGASFSPENLQDPCLKLLKLGLTELNLSRQREGEKLKQMILERVERIDGLIQHILPLIPQIQMLYQEKLTNRLREALSAVDEDRIRQEVILFATKIDVAEELNRLGSHVTEVRHILAQGRVIGKKLDFLMQELNREANTLASKSASIEITNMAMELKLLIEQMREQVQNIE